MDALKLKEILDEKVAYYNNLSFIEKDPISIPHKFTQKQDIEIAGLFAAVFAWGNRTIILQKGNELMERMDHAPYDFVMNHSDKDLQRLVGFKHRTFNDTDLLYFIHFLQHIYNKYDSLEKAFFDQAKEVESGLIHFQRAFMSLPEFPNRTKKHISSPRSHSHCKRLNMFLRWMIRTDKQGVDFGIWNSITPAQLIMPIDVHVSKVAQQLGLLENDKLNWNTAVELTKRLQTFDKNDPVKYDFALFSIGINKDIVI